MNNKNLLKKSKIKDGIKFLLKYKIELIKLHQNYVKEINLYDQITENYNINDAIKCIKEEIIYLKDLYFLKLYQVKNFETFVINGYMV